MVENQNLKKERNPLLEENSGGKPKFTFSTKGKERVNNLCISVQKVRKESFPESERTTKRSFPCVCKNPKATIAINKL